MDRSWKHGSRKAYVCPYTIIEDLSYDQGMCKNLVEKGNLQKPLVIFNRTQKRAEDVNVELGAGKSLVASSLEEAVTKADIVFTCLGDDAAIKDTIVEAVKKDVSGKLFVDCSTVHPDTTTMLAKTVQEKGATFVASPVFGAPAMAEGGQLVFVLGNHIDCMNKSRPLAKI